MRNCLGKLPERWLVTAESFEQYLEREPKINRSVFGQVRFSQRRFLPHFLPLGQPMNSTDLIENVFITGVSSGIGFGLAKAYVDRGANVFGVSRRQPPEPLVSAEHFRFAALDLTEESNVKPTIEGLLGELATSGGRLNTVILNAGVLGQIGDLNEISLAELRATMNVNVWSNKTLVDVLLDLGAIDRIVAISSGAAAIP